VSFRDRTRVRGVDMVELGLSRYYLYGRQHSAEDTRDGDGHRSFHDEYKKRLCVSIQMTLLDDSELASMERHHQL